MSDIKIDDDMESGCATFLLLGFAVLLALVAGATAWRLCWLGPDWLVACAPLVAFVAACASGRLLGWLVPGLRKIAKAQKAYMDAKAEKKP